MVPVAVGLALVLLVPAPLVGGGGEAPGPAVLEEPTLQTVAEELYGEDAYMIVEASQASDVDAFERTFPSHTLYYALEVDRFPATVHTFALNDNEPREGFDLTRDYSDLMVSEGVVVATPEDALRHATVIAKHSNSDLHHPFEVVDASDSERLGMAIDDPRTESLLTGYEVRLSTWSPANGVLANWTIDLDFEELREQEYLVVDLGVGDDAPEWTHTELVPNTWVFNHHGDTHTRTIRQEEDGTWETLGTRADLEAVRWTTVTERTNDDGTSWTVLADADADLTSLESWADDLATAGTNAYETFIESSSSACAGQTNNSTSWGLHHRGSACTIEIRILPEDILACAACLQLDDTPTFYVSPRLHQVFEEIGWYSANHSHAPEDTAETALGHLYLAYLTKPTPQGYGVVSVQPTDQHIAPHRAADRHPS